MNHVFRRSPGGAVPALRVLLVAVLNLGCAFYQGTAKDVQPLQVARSGNWVVAPRVPLVMQQSNHDCGAAALAAVLRFWGHPTSPDQVVAATGRGGKRLSAGDLSKHARSAGLLSYVFYGTMTDIAYELNHGRPVIVGLGKSYQEGKALAHYEVVVGYEPHTKQVLLLDPGGGWKVDSFAGFGKEWSVSKGVTVVVFPQTVPRPIGAGSAGT
jgi:ABC-type bacteriocin/lantibiotic exporter with double-glycine peptidase domain